MPPLGEGAAAAVLKMKQERKKKARVSLTALTHFIPLKKTPPASLHSRDDRPTDQPVSFFHSFLFLLIKLGRERKRGERIEAQSKVTRANCVVFLPNLDVVPFF